jgi:hypothetical protein
MCYSFEASLTAGVGLGLVGYGMVAKALRRDRRMLAFALFPLVFSAQQFIEGGVWLTLRDPQDGQLFRYLYTLIAFCLWPVLTPYAAAYAEADPERRRLWRLMVAIGAVLAAYLTAKLALADGIALTVVRHSLAYDPAVRASAARRPSSLCASDRRSPRREPAPGRRAVRLGGARRFRLGARRESSCLVFGLVHGRGLVQLRARLRDRRAAQLRRRSRADAAMTRPIDFARPAAHCMKMSDETSLLAANAAYYRAFISGDVDAMAQIWGHDDISCIHPGWPPLIGREPVLASYRDILRNPLQEPIVRRNERALLSGTDGRVVCVEVVGGAALVATNWFRLVEGAWRLVHHQASPLAVASAEPPPEPPRSLH